MSKNEFYLSKSIMNTEVLFCNSLTQEKNGVVASHSHTFWQMELLQEGQFNWFSSNGKKLMSPKQLLLIPPGEFHGFEYFDTFARIVSIKFEWKDQLVKPESGVLIGELPSVVYMHIQSIFNYIFENQNKFIRETGVNLMLQAILIHLVKPVEDDANSLYSQILKKIALLNGKRMQVSDIAKSMNLSTSHLSREFRKLHGGPLKTYIDEATLAIAKKYLKFTGHSISNIGNLLGFPDVYSFSHFFKKYTGISPKEFRDS